MIIYEVNITVENTIFNAYKKWLAQHIALMLKFPGFNHAEIWQENIKREETSKKAATQTEDSKAFTDLHITSISTPTPTSTKLEKNQPLPDKTLLTVWYHVDKLETLENYLQHYAKDMRADAVKIFGDKFSATRRTLNRLED